MPTSIYKREDPTYYSLSEPASNSASSFPQRNAWRTDTVTRIRFLRRRHHTASGRGPSRHPRNGQRGTRWYCLIPQAPMVLSAPDARWWSRATCPVDGSVLIPGVRTRLGRAWRVAAGTGLGGLPAARGCSGRGTRWACYWSITEYNRWLWIWILGAPVKRNRDISISCCVSHCADLVLSQTCRIITSQGKKKNAAYLSINRPNLLSRIRIQLCDMAY